MPRVTLVLLLAILLLGTALRLSRLDLCQYWLDQARATRLAIDMVSGHGLATHGIESSLQVDNPPGFVWILAPAVCISSHPLWLTAYIGLLNIVGLVLLFRLGQMLANDAVGLAAAALLAASPFAVQYSRSIWAQDTLPPLTTACALCLLYALRSSRPALVMVSAVLLAVILQVHLSAVAFGLTWGTALLIAASGMRRLRWAAAASLAVGILLFAPFLIYESTIGFHDVVVPPPMPGHNALADLYWTFSLLTGNGFDNYFLGFEADAFERHLGYLAPLTRFLGGSLAAAIAVGLVGCLLRLCNRRGTDLAAAMLMPCWLLFPFLGTALRNLHPNPHYFIVSLPAQAYLAAWALFGWSNSEVRWSVPRSWRQAAGIFCLVVVAVHFLYFQRLNQFLEVVPHTNGDFRITYRDLRDKTRQTASTPGGRNRLLHSEFGRFLLEYGHMID